MLSSQPVVSERGATFARLAARVLETLNDAVDKRRSEGETLSEIAERIGCHRSLLSRVLNGTSPNLTLRTIADVLWAARFEPADFAADPIEAISPNWTHYTHTEGGKRPQIEQTQVIKFDVSTSAVLAKRDLQTTIRVLEGAL